MLPQQFQHAHVLPDSDTAAVPILQPCSQFAKRRREFPVAVDVRVIQSGRASIQRHQVMQRIKHLVARFVAANMRGHDLEFMDDVDPIDVAFHRHGLEGHRSRNAVRHVVKACELVLVDFRGLLDAGVEAMLWQRSRVLQVVLQPLADGVLRIARWTRPIVPATFPQIRVEFLEVLHAGNRSPPATLQRLHTILDDRFFVAARGHAEQRIEDIVARQGRVAPIHFSVTTTQQCNRHGLRVVPPDFSWNALEKLERLHHAFENRFGPFGW